MTPSELSHYGRTFYGPRWQTEMSRALGVHRNLVGRWARGGRIPGWVDDRLRDIGAEKLAEWQRLSDCDRWLRLQEIAGGGE